MLLNGTPRLFTFAARRGSPAPRHPAPSTAHGCPHGAIASPWLVPPFPCGVPAPPLPAGFPDGAVCGRCNRSFTAAEARALHRAEAERLARDLTGGAGAWGSGSGG